MQYPVGNIGAPTIKAIALKNKAKPALVNNGKMPARDMSSFRDKIVSMAAAKRNAAPKPANAGSNAQTEAYGKAMNSAFKNTKTFGVPGAK